jgi:MFS family permease
VLIALTAINFVNYVDRYVVSAIAEQIREEFDLGDDVTGLLGSTFMIVYTVVAPLSGWLGDRVRRGRVVAASVAVWSLATVGSGMVDSVEGLLLCRAIVGVGEAGYATVAPSIIADLFAPAERGRRLSWFYLATPVGSALGYLLGGWVGELYGWRTAFFVAGSPGLLLAMFAWWMHEPVRGAFDEGAKMEVLGLRDAWRTMRSSYEWRTTTIGMTLMTFAIGGIAFWMPTFLQRQYEIGAGAANTMFGAVTVVAGLVGTLVGGALGDRAMRRHRGGYFQVSGLGLLLGAPMVFAMPLVPDLTLAMICAFCAELLLFLNTGPLNAALVGSVPPAMRSIAFAINVFCIHAFGDAGSPWLIGFVSVHSELRWAIAGCAVPVAAGGLVLWLGARRLRLARSDSREAR